ncbi:MAG TPA: hypothetical protein VF880_15105, partial [Actinomycetes bacterium]
MTRSRTAVLAGIGIAVLYLAGAALSGRASPLARRPLLDGLAPPVPYRWVKPPADLAAGNKPPASLRASVKLTATGSQIGAFATSDGQVNLVLSEGAVPARAGQTSVAVSIDPVDPATLAPAPPGLTVAGNAYHIQAAYRPSGARIDTLGGRSSVGLVYPLLTTAIANPSGHLVLASTDGRSWQRLQSTDTPGTHQVSAPLGTTGYVMAAVPPAGPGGGGGNGRGRVLLLAGGVAVLLVLAALLARRRGAAR